MINVGIHSSVVLEKLPVINEKGTLEIYMRKGSEVDALDAFNSASDSAGAGVENNTFLEFNQLDTVRFGNELTAKQISEDIINFKNKLAHIVLLFKTEDKCVWDIIRGTGINKDNRESKLLDKGVLDIIYNNICEDFIKNFQDVDLSKEFHLKTVRQSAAKHYSKLPDSKFGYSGQNAFVQDGSLQCTLKYSKYEIEKGKNDPTPVASSSINQEDAAEQSAAIDDVFGA